MLDFRVLGCFTLTMAVPWAMAQNIERVRLTDNDLTCSQIYAEVQQMDMAVKLSGPVANGPVAPAIAAPAYDPVAGGIPMFASGSPVIRQAVAVDPAFAALVSKVTNPASLPSLEAQAAQILANRQSLAGVQRAGMGAVGNASINQAQMAQLMAVSNDPKVRAAATDPAAVAQVTAMMQNPQLAVAAQRAGAAGVNPALIQSQLAAAGMLQQAAPAGSGVPVAPTTPTAPVAAAGLAGLFGALAGGRAGLSGAQTANLLGAVAAAQVTGPPVAAVPAQATAPAPGTPTTAPPGTAAPGMAAQAQARKDHLTQLFLGKGCKLSALP